MKTIAFSYVRWSSPKQGGDKDSFRRQTAQAQKVAEDNGWTLIDLPPEKGVSAYKGKNLDHGSILGSFIKKVEDGQITTPCVLIVEKLDRFSRKDADEIIPVFLKLLNAGVEVYSCSEGVHYTKKSLKDNPMLTILQMTLAFVAANQYSRILSKRVKEGKQRKIQRAKAGEVIEMYGSTPAYFDFKNGKYVINKHSETVRKIYDLALAGVKPYSIVKILNKENTPTFQTAKHWSRTTVLIVLNQRQPLGEYCGNQDYYPRIVSIDEYNQVQGMLAKGRIGKGRTSEYPNLFRGLMTCECGKPVFMSKVVNNGKVYRYFQCSSKFEGNNCGHKTNVKMSLFEERLFALVLQSDPKELIYSSQDDTGKKVFELEERLLGVSAQIQRLIGLVDLGLDEVRTQLVNLKEQRANLEEELTKLRVIQRNPKNELSQLKTLIASDDDRGLDEALRTMVANLSKEDVRQKVQPLIPSIISHVVLKEGHKAEVGIVGNGTVELWLGD